MSTELDDDAGGAPDGPRVNPAEVARVTREQAVAEFARALEDYMPLESGQIIGNDAWEHLLEGYDESAPVVAAQLRMLEPGALYRAAMKGGKRGAMAEIDWQLGIERPRSPRHRRQRR